MKDHWVISDTHFGHANILKFDPPRPFSSVSEMDETMIERWNECVKPGDVVYHLGDVFFGDKEQFKRLWPRLNGKKYLIVGNHDDIKFLSSGGFFSKVLMWRVLNNMIFTHVPIHESSFRKDASLNVHGHIHFKKSPDGPYKCVCVEQTDYRPINIDEIKI